MSDTPLTNAEAMQMPMKPDAESPSGWCSVVRTKFARGLERDNAELVAFLKRLRDEPSLLKAPRAGGQDQYAGMPPAYRIIDHLLSKRKQ